MENGLDKISPNGLQTFSKRMMTGKIKTAALMFSNVYGILGKTAAADELIKLHLKDKQEG